MIGTTTYEYDLLDRVTRVIDRNGKATIYEYDALGNRSAMRYPNGNVVTYTYDACQRLKEEWIVDSRGITLAKYTYGIGKAGERTSVTEVNSSGIETTTTYEYDKLLRLTKETIERDENKLIYEYTYDYNGNRTSKTDKDGNTTYYVNDTSGSLTMVVAEMDEAGKEKAYYTRGLELISMEKEDEIWYYLYDGHGNVRNLTNEEGRVTDRYTYEAYGTLIENKGDTENEFLYTGEQYNTFSGFYYLRARYMNPGTGTFISKDSYQGNIYDPVTLHKYLYANANPVMYTDPSGYFSVASLATCKTASEILNASWRFIAFSTLMGAVSGAACSVVDSMLGESSFSQAIKDAWKGAGVGVFLGVVISALACFSVISPICMAVLQCSQKIFLVCGMVGALVSVREGKPAQAVFRAILSIFAYKGTGKLIGDAKLAIFKGGTSSGYYQDVNGRWHRPNGQFASNSEVGITSADKVSTGSHGNSLSDPRTNYGYALIDRNTNEILKFGETIHPTTRYSQSYLDANNANMIILEQGSKLDIHLWQHDMNEYYFYKYNEYPPFNSGGW